MSSLHFAGGRASSPHVRHASRQVASWLCALVVLLSASLPGWGSTPDLINGSNIVATRCFTCHGIIVPPRAASLKLITEFANGGAHGGGPGPFLEANLNDLAAYVSSWYQGLGCSFFGSVVDTAGHGIPQARVRVTCAYLDLPPTAVAKTTADGGFTLSGLPPGDLQITAEASGYSFLPDAFQPEIYQVLYGQAINLDFIGKGSDSPPWDQVTITEPPIHVKPDGNDQFNGRSWLTAKRTIQRALDAAPDGGRVFLASGVYHERVVVMGKELYGGFAGTEADLSQCDPWANPVILDGGASADPPVTPGTVVVVGDAGTRHARLEGLGIQNGFTSWPEGIGGGICVSNGAAPTIARCHLWLNRADYGGAIGCLPGAAPVVVESILANNYAFMGGGLYADWDSTPVLLANNLFLANTSDSGGAALHCYTGAQRVINNTFVSNASADGVAGAMYFLLGMGVTANNLVAFNSAGIEDDAGGTDLRHNCVFGNTNGNYLSTAASPSDLEADPRLADVGGWNCRLRPGSPCVDAGDAAAAAGLAVDLDGHPRIARAAVDIGAYELPAPALRAVAGADGLQLSWALEETDFVLEMKTNLLSPWQPCIASSAINRSERAVLVPWSNSAAFFRLRK